MWKVLALCLCASPCAQADTWTVTAPGLCGFTCKLGPCVRVHVRHTRTGAC